MGIYGCSGLSRWPMALFISPCRWSTLLERAPESVPRWASDCRAVGILATSGVSDSRVGEGKWLIGMASLGMAACSHACWEVAISLGMAKTDLSGLSRSSTLMVNGAPLDTDIGLLGVLSPKAGPKVSSTIWDKSSWSLVAMLMWLAISLGHSAAEHGEEGSVEALWGPGMRGILSPGIAWGRSTYSGKDSQTGLPRVFISHIGGCDTESSTGFSPPFKPLWHTTWPPHCRSLCSCNWWRCLQAFLLSTPSIMVLIWPSLDKGTCRVPWLSHMKAFTQLSSMLMIRVSFLTTSSKEKRHAWCCCAHTMASLNAISPLTILPSAIKRYATWHWGFSASSHAPVSERAKSSDQVTSFTWNHDREGQISWGPHSIWVNSFHRLGSLEKCA